MRVLHIVTAFPRNEGDVITPWLAEMLRGLKARGVEVEVFTSSYQGLGDQVLWGIPVHRFRYFPKRWENLTHEEIAIDRIGRSPLYKLLPAFYVLFGSLAILGLCRRQKYDVVHVHWPLPHAIFGWLAKHACGAKLATTFYGVEIRWAKHSLPLLKRFLAWAIRTSDKVVAISSYTAGEVQSIAEGPVEVIPYTIGFAGNSKNQIPSSKGREKIVLTVGRLVERKGVRYLIEAMRHLPASLNARLVVVGGGPLKAELEDLTREKGLGERVKFAGKVSEQELVDYYRNAAVYVQPAIFDSRGDTEMLGVVMLEAMHHGVPVIGSAVGGIPDVVRHEATGLLVPEKDSLALAQAIGRVLNDAELRAKMVKNAYSSLHGNFSWDNILDRWIKAYNKL